MALSSVGVVVPCYRYGRFLRECVASVLAQRGVDVRVLIIDDASPDDSADIAIAIAAEDSRVALLRHQANRGHIATYNEGLDWISADYTMLVSADDYLLPGALARATELLDKHPEVAFAFGRALELLTDGSLQRSMKIIKGDATHEIISGLQFIKLSRSRNIVPTPTVIVRTRVQKKVGGYCPELPHTGDMEMWLRLAAHGSVAVMDADLAVYRVHDANMSAAYNRQFGLPDLIHREAALDFFMATQGDRLDDAQTIRRSAFSDLSRKAVSLASCAFNEGEMALSKKLAEYAVELSPDVKRSLPWLKLSMKKWLGLKRWRVLQAVLAPSARTSAK